MKRYLRAIYLELTKLRYGRQKTVLVTSADGNIQLVDALNKMAANGAVDYVLLYRTQFVCGSKFDYVNAIMHLAEKFEFRND